MAWKGYRYIVGGGWSVSQGYITLCYMPKSYYKFDPLPTPFLPLQGTGIGFPKALQARPGEHGRPAAVIQGGRQAGEWQRPPDRPGPTWSFCNVVIIMYAYRCVCVCVWCRCVCMGRSHLHLLLFMCYVWGKQKEVPPCDGLFSDWTG